MKNIKKPKIIYFIFVLSVLAALYLTANAISIWDYSTKVETRTADIAIILGAAANDEGVSPVFRERINHGILLYQKGYVKKLIITGGYGKGHHYSDSYIGKQYAVEQGIPADDILLEETSTITEENLENAKIIMDHQRYDTALIVSDPLHMKRAMLLAKDVGLNAYTSPTGTSMYRSSFEKFKFGAREVFFYAGYKIVKLLPFL